MTSELILILRDFFPRSDASEPDSAPARLPALESLLAMADRQPLAHGWRASLAERFATPEVAAMAPAAAAALAWLASPGLPAVQYWLATPVHYFAGLDCVHLHPDGLLQLSDSAQQALVADFGRVFGQGPWGLHALGRRELLLSGPPLAQSAQDPAQFAGRDPAGGLPRGASAARLRGLGAEIEMWLHEHRINQERERNGELPVGALWLWGALPAHAGTSAAVAATAGPGGHLYGEDAYAEALWRLQRGPAAPLPAHFQAMARSAGGRAVVLYPTLGHAGLGAALQRFEQGWLVPALAALRARQLSAIELLAGKHSYRLCWWQLARFWRRRPAWWERLA
jgi:hypothetical protein